MKTQLNYVIAVTFCFFLATTATSQTAYDKDMIALAKQTADRVKEQEKLNVAVWFFHNTKGKRTELGDYVGRDFSIHFTNVSKGFDVIDRDHIEQYVAEHRLNAEGFIDPATAKEIGKITAADAIVTGTVDVSLHTLRIRIKIINTTTGKQIAAAVSNVSIDEGLKAILEQTDFNKPVRDNRPTINTNEKKNDKRTTNRKCEELQVGDYYFKNESEYTYKIDVFGIGNKIRRGLSVDSGQMGSVADLPAGSYRFSLYKNNLRTTHGPSGTSSFRIETCESKTYVIKQAKEYNIVNDFYKQIKKN